MPEDPWLKIVGLGEDGLNGLSAASRTALDEARFVMGPRRHLDLLPDLEARKILWPVPFSAGVAELMALRGAPVVVLASGDPFWFGAGSVLARQLDPSEWRAIPGLSTFALVAAHKGWPLEKTRCLGLHAAPLTRLRGELSPGVKLIVLLRGGASVAELAGYLSEIGFGDSDLTICEAVGGPRERFTETCANNLPETAFSHPLCVAIDVKGQGTVLPRTSGRADGFFDSDGQITKQPVRALTLSALAPCPFECLWDIGGGSGSIGIEWLLSDPTTEAISIEPRADRATRISENAHRLGVDRLHVVTGLAPDALVDLDRPDAVFIGGGLSDGLLRYLYDTLESGTRIVANAVTLESEATLARWQEKLGGDLIRIELARAVPLGTRRGWRSAYPVVQWSVTL